MQNVWKRGARLKINVSLALKNILKFLPKREGGRERERDKERERVMKKKTNKEDIKVVVVVGVVQCISFTFVLFHSAT